MAPKRKKNGQVSGKGGKKKIEKQLKKSTEKLRGRRTCPTCGSQVYIRSFQCPTCKHKFIPKKHVVTIESVLKKTSEKSILTILENNFFNSCKQDQQPGVPFDSKFRVLSRVQDLNQDSVIKVEQKPHRVKFYQATKLADNIRVFSCKNPLKTVCINQYGLAFSEELSVQPDGINQKDLLTMKAYGLGHFHKLGHKYSGVSYLYFSPGYLEDGFYRAQIRKNIVAMQLSLNMIAILCGDGSVMFYCLPQQKPPHNQAISLQEACHIPDLNASAICWTNVLNMLICGDYDGNIKVYSVSPGSQPVCTRKYVHAHHQYITTIKCCPLNNQDSLVFASGSYDGFVKLWNYYELECIYQFDVTNKNVNCLVWDTGAKFLLVSRDDNSDGCSLLTFFSTNKTDKKQILVSECQQRYVKEYNEYELLSSSRESQYVVLGSVYGNVEICDMEYFRKASIKKKNHSLTKLSFDRVSLSKHPGYLQIKETKVQEREDPFSLADHIISGVGILERNQKQKVAITTYPGLLVVMDFEPVEE